MITSTDLEAKWSSLQPPGAASMLSGVRIAGLPLNVPAYLALDAEQRRHLLIRIDPASEVLAQRPSRGLEINVHDLRIGDSPEARYLDLSPSDGSLDSIFVSITTEIVRELAVSIDPKSDVLAILKRWRWFWGVDPERLGRDGALGLFGELWFLFRWLAPVGLTKVERWVGPEGFRHDFQWPEASVEVKTASGSPPGGTVHRIANLDQLDNPIKGKLYLFSLHVTDDALAANTLPSLVNWFFQALSNDENGRSLFEQKLAKVGYSPAVAHLYERPLKVSSEELYEVTDGFPRLTKSSFPSGLPAGIENLTYTLSMAACSRWRIATAPTETVSLVLQ